MDSPQSKQPEKPQSVTVSLLKFVGLMTVCILLAWLATVLLDLVGTG